MSSLPPSPRPLPLLRLLLLLPPLLPPSRRLPTTRGKDRTVLEVEPTPTELSELRTRTLPLERRVSSHRPRLPFLLLSLLRPRSGWNRDGWRSLISGRDTTGARSWICRVEGEGRRPTRRRGKEMGCLLLSKIVSSALWIDLPLRHQRYSSSPKEDTYFNFLSRTSFVLLSEFWSCWSSFKVSGPTTRDSFFDFRRVTRPRDSRLPSTRQTSFHSGLAVHTSPVSTISSPTPAWSRCLLERTRNEMLTFPPPPSSLPSLLSVDRAPRGDRNVTRGRGVPRAGRGAGPTAHGGSDRKSAGHV